MNEIREPGLEGDLDIQTQDSRQNSEGNTAETENGKCDRSETSEEEEDLSERSEEEEDDDEPRFKYHHLTKSIGSVYKNGDATSCFLASGDKLIMGTHNGCIHVISVPSFELIQVYRPHSASVTSISVSPFFTAPSPTSSKKSFPGNITHIQASTSSTGHSPGSHRQRLVPPTPSNQIYIASSSIDGNVCVVSLIDTKRDIILRNFGRPVQTVALSPNYKHDRTFVSGGLAGNLVLTIGGRIGARSDATILGTGAANAHSWLGSLGFTPNNGKDTILHGGEGTINAIKWSFSGKYVTWVNEEGIKIMRTHLHLEGADSEFAWTRLCHIDRPRRPGWEEMAAVWRARVEWAHESLMENKDVSLIGNESTSNTQGHNERLVVGWGGTIWIINVYPDSITAGKAGDRRLGFVELATILRTDCIISGISLYTSNLLLVLAYIIPEEVEGAATTSPRRGGIRHKQNGLPPELRLIDIQSKKQIASDTQDIRRYESLNSSDYHLGILPPSQALEDTTTQRSALEMIGAGLWDATMYPTRLFNSDTSIRSTNSNGDKSSSAKEAPSFVSSRLSFADKQSRDAALKTTGSVKIFIHSPFDCIIAVKRGLSDHLIWLEEHERYEEAWKLIDDHPEAVLSSAAEEGSVMTPTNPNDSDGLSDFFGEDAMTCRNSDRHNSTAEKEKRRLGDLFLQQLVSERNWVAAGRVCARVLNTTSGWEHWILKFVKNGKFDEITSFIPNDLVPPLPSLVYEIILGHYAAYDRSRFKQLLGVWSTDLFDITSVIVTVEEQLKTVKMETDDWYILADGLARLYLADGHYREALRYYIKIQDTQTAMNLIRDYHLLEAVADDIPSLILLHVSKDLLKNGTNEELEVATSNVIELIVHEAHNGVVTPELVVEQLTSSNWYLFLYFYFKTLWRPSDKKESQRGRGRFHSHHVDVVARLREDEGRAATDKFADTVVEVFADYDRPLLMEFLQVNTAYSFETACEICESRHYIAELIFLLSKTGQTKHALRLILTDLKDISQAILFVKAQDDPDLWEDLISYSMDKPEYIRCLLTEAGTFIDPIALVRRIPSGLEIEGLRQGLTGLIREYDILASISEGVARVLSGEVATRLDVLRRGQRRGIKFNVVQPREMDGTPDKDQEYRKEREKDPNSDDILPGCCAGCLAYFSEQETEPLVGFECGHVYHVSHLHSFQGGDNGAKTLTPKNTQYDHGEEDYIPRTVGPKVTTARLLRDKIGDGCRICTNCHGS